MKNKYNTRPKHTYIDNILGLTVLKTIQDLSILT